MGQRGPKPLPANVHLLRGNPSRLSADKLHDAVSPDIEIPAAPRHMKGEALKEWKRITPALLKLGLVSQIDRAALAMYCTAWGRHVDAESALRDLGEAGLVAETPTGQKVQGVWLTVSNKAMEQCHKFLSEFGMSPSARARVTPGALQPDLFDGTTSAKPSIGSLMK